MSRINPNSIRIARANDLDLLGRILENLGICSSSPLFAAAEECRKGHGVPKDRWGYSVTNLVLQRSATHRGIRPKDATDVYHSLDVSAQGAFVADDHQGDPFIHLSVDIAAGARVGKRPLFCAWHLDRHLMELANQSGSCTTADSERQADNNSKPNREDETPAAFGFTGPSSELHPLYHFHFGGRRMMNTIDDGSGDLGDILLLAPPRIAHPPLDAVLAVDFVVGNFYPHDYKTLRDDEGYLRLIHDAQVRCWKPYANVCAGAWSKKTFIDWTPELIWPALHSV